MILLKYLFYSFVLRYGKEDNIGLDLQKLILQLLLEYFVGRSPQMRSKQLNRTLSPSEDFN